jgi:hypothetical protein
VPAKRTLDLHNIGRVKPPFWIGFYSLKNNWADVAPVDFGYAIVVNFQHNFHFFMPVKFARMGRASLGRAQ